jgi:hypothetical protein
VRDELVEQPPLVVDPLAARVPIGGAESLGRDASTGRRCGARDVEGGVATGEVAAREGLLVCVDLDERRPSTLPREPVVEIHRAVDDRRTRRAEKPPQRGRDGADLHERPGASERAAHQSTCDLPDRAPPRQSLRDVLLDCERTPPEHGVRRELARERLLAERGQLGASLAGEPLADEKSIDDAVDPRHAAGERPLDRERMPTEVPEPGALDVDLADAPAAGGVELEAIARREVGALPGRRRQRPALDRHDRAVAGKQLLDGGANVP